jgi:2-iminobutanoate/2-iminopropanoate deaminase
MRNNKIILLIGSCLLCFAATRGQQNNIGKEKHHWGAVEQDTTWGYAGVVKTGSTLYLSGVTAAGDFPTQVRQVYAAIENNLKKYGATFQNVVKENLFTTNMDSMKHHASIRKEFYKGDYPAATWVEIRKLFSPDRMLEVEVIAELPEKIIMPNWPMELLPGTWGMQNKDGWLYETWERVSENLYKGKSFSVKGKDTTLLESVELKKTAQGIFYIPVALGQNNDKPVPFKLVQQKGNLFIFENLKHDFPKRIGYEFVSGERLRAWIDGGPEAVHKRMDFNYKKIK